MVQVDDRWLQIEKIGVRTIAGRTAAGEQVLIPNAPVAQATVTNLTQEDKLSRIRTRVGVDLTADVELVERVLREAVLGPGWVSSKAEGEVFLAEFTRFSIEFVVAVWIEEPDKIHQRKSELNTVVWSKLSKAGTALA